MKSYLEEAGQIQDLLNQGKVEHALQSARKLISRHPSNPAVSLICSGVLIDCGTALGVIEPVDLGISVIEDVLENLPDLTGKDLEDV